jgi:glycosyltransferase involved in cell wall biosynthesis
MKVVHVITGLNGGGGQYYMLRLLENLPRRIESQVISLTTPGVVGPQLEAAGFRVSSLGITPATGVFRISSLIRALRSAQPDVVHTWMYHSDLLGGISAKIAGLRPILWSVHHGRPTVEYDKARTVAIARVCAALGRVIPDHIVCASETTRDAHVRLGYPVEKMSVIPGGYDLSRFQPSSEARTRVRNALGIAADATVLGMVARYHILKGHRDFLEMAAILVQQHPELRFVLAGRDVDRDNFELMQAVRGLNLEPFVHLVGAREDIHRVMAAFDLLVSPSLAEAGPLVVGEAMACAVPVVSTDVGIARSLIGDAGWITPVSDPAAMALTVEQFMAMPAVERNELGARARSRILSTFSIQSTARAYESLYERLMTG